MNKLECEFLHKKVDMLVNLKAVEIVGVPLEPHEEPSVADVRTEPPPGALPSLPGTVLLYTQSQTRGAEVPMDAEVLLFRGPILRTRGAGIIRVEKIPHSAQGRTPHSTST